jgi:hypothetical protein
MPDTIIEEDEEKKMAVQITLTISSEALSCEAPGFNGIRRKIEMVGNNNKLTIDNLVEVIEASAYTLAADLLDQRAQEIRQHQLLEERALERERFLERERLSRMRSFDCPLTESRCIEGGCSRTHCVRQEREEEQADRRRQEERARQAHGASRGRGRETKAEKRAREAREAEAQAKKLII